MHKDESFEAIYLRLLQITGVKTDSALARLLDIKPQSVVAARKRRQIPPGWLVSVAKTYGVATDWLFFGQGPISLDEKEEEVSGRTIHKAGEIQDIENQLAEKNQRITELERQLAQAKEETLKAYRLLVDTQQETLKAYRLAVGAMHSPVETVQVPPPPHYRQTVQNAESESPDNEK